MYIHDLKSRVDANFSVYLLLYPSIHLSTVSTYCILDLVVFMLLWIEHTEQSFQFNKRTFKRETFIKQTLHSRSVFCINTKRKPCLLQSTVKQEVQAVSETQIHTHHGRITSAERHENSCWRFYMVMDHCLIHNPRNTHTHAHSHSTHTFANLPAPVLAACVVVCDCG